MKSAVPEEDLAMLKISRDDPAVGPIPAKNKIRQALLIALPFLIAAGAEFERRAAVSKSLSMKPGTAQPDPFPSVSMARQLAIRASIHP